MKTWVVTTAVGGSVLLYAVRKAKTDLEPKQVPVVSLVGAFIFAAQMINFPVAGATSGHFLGGALATILFGPYIGFMILSAVLMMQAFVFQDGGITVLGANLLCTGFIGCFLGNGVFRVGTRLLRGRFPAAVAFAAGWCSIVGAAVCVSMLLAVSGTVPLSAAVPAMAGWHSLIGIGEGLITALVSSYLLERNGIHQKKERPKISSAGSCR